MTKRYRADEAAAFDGAALETALTADFGEAVSEAVFAAHVLAWLENAEDNAERIDRAARYAAWATLSEAGMPRWHGATLFRVPRKTDDYALIVTEPAERAGVGVLLGPGERQRHRRGFALTDPGMDLPHVLDQANYGIWCTTRRRTPVPRGSSSAKPASSSATPSGSCSRAARRV